MTNRNEKLINLAMDRSFVIALSDWADPNERCAAIMIQIALYSCSNLVKIGFKNFSKSTIEASCYGISIFLPDAPSRRNFEWSPVSYNDVENMLRKKLNLATYYHDHVRNVRATDYLHEYLPLTKSENEKIAVFCIAWSILQRKKLDDDLEHIVMDYNPPDPDGQIHLIRVENIGIEIHFNSKRITSFKYPPIAEWMIWPEE